MPWPTGVATTFVPSRRTATTVTSPYALLDAFNDNASKQVADIMKDAGITRLDLFFAAGVFSVGTVAFLCVAVFVVSLATVFITFVIAVGPIFILCLAWKPTQRFFDSWLSMLLNADRADLVRILRAGTEYLHRRSDVTAIARGGGFHGCDAQRARRSHALLRPDDRDGDHLLPSPEPGVALTGGAAIQQGIQMVQNAMMVAGLRSARAPSATGLEHRAASSAPVPAYPTPPESPPAAPRSPAHASRERWPQVPAPSPAVSMAKPAPPLTASPPSEAAPERKDSHETSPAPRCHRRRRALCSGQSRAQGIPVIDIANLIQTIQQVMNDITKIENQVEQIRQLRARSPASTVSATSATSSTTPGSTTTFRRTPLPWSTPSTPPATAG
jgi:type IV secretion system protein VirB6